MTDLARDELAETGRKEGKEEGREKSSQKKLNLFEDLATLDCDRSSP